MISKGILFFFLSLVFIQYCKSQDTNILWSTINGASSLTIDQRGNVYVSSPKENIIYQLSNVDGHAEVFAGTGNSGLVDGDAFTTAQFNQPQGLAYDHNNAAFYVCDYGNNAIRKIYQGIVSTLPVTVESPVSITIVNAYINYQNIPQTPVGFYVVSEDGTVTLVQDGPVNDNCQDATFLGTPSATAPLIIYGTLDKASIDTGFYPCENTQGTLQVEFPQYSIWYTFTGTGNLVNVSACNSQTHVYSNLFVYRPTNPTLDDSCDTLQCMGWVYSESHHNCYGSLLSFCTQPNITYYVAVSIGYYYNEHSYGTLELAIFDIGPIGCEECTCDTSKCQTNVCRGFCEDAPACSGDSSCIEGNCFLNAPNDQCDGAIEIVGNSTVSGNTLKDIAPLTPVIGEGNCEQIRNHGLWYKTVGTGFLTYLDTCSINTEIPVIIHLYKEIEGSSCTDNLLCVDLGFQVSSYGCPTTYNSELIYCSEEGATYYYFIEATYNLGPFGLVQETSETPCVVGYDYNPPNDYFYSSFFWY